MSDWQQMGFANMASRMRDLESGVLSMAEDVPMLIEAVTRLDADIERLIASRRDTLATLSQHDETLRELSASVKRLTVQVAWIEQHLRSSGSAWTVDLDHADPDLIGLAATAEAGRAAAAVLLGPPDRATLVSDVSRHADAVTRHRAAIGALLAACERLASGDREGAARRQTRSEYQVARTAVTERAALVAACVEPAEQARARLAADDAERERVAGTVAEGERAERELLTRLRTRIASAVSDGAMLPAWLTGPLGPMPAAGAAQRWTDLAAGLLAYRITYGVTDPADAVGELPASAGERRRRGHADLGRGVRELRR
ncbi:MAG TPA: hypothetical protein VI248_26230 [Kineosporiaceae bacterium]